MKPIGPIRVVLLAYDQMNLLDLSGPLQALATAGRSNRNGGPPLYATTVLSVDGGLITTGCGLPIMTAALASLDGVAIDTLIAPGGCAGETYDAPAALAQWIAARAPSVRRVASVCTGAFLLAAAGLLEGRRAATHWDWAERLRIRHPGIEVDADRIFVQDGRVWTSAGVSAGIDLTLALIEDDYGHAVAIETARQLVMFVKRSGGQSQFSVPLASQTRGDARFTDLHAWMAANLAADLRVEQLAERAGMTPRTFARVYAETVGRTPARAVAEMRLEAACRALEETGLPLKRVAAVSGYTDEQRLRRAFVRQLGVGPCEYRARFSAHGPAAIA